MTRSLLSHMSPLLDIRILHRRDAARETNVNVLRPFYIARDRYKFVSFTFDSVHAELSRSMPAFQQTQRRTKSPSTGSGRTEFLGTIHQNPLMLSLSKHDAKSLRTPRLCGGNFFCSSFIAIERRSVVSPCRSHSSC